MSNRIGVSVMIVAFLSMIGCSDGDSSDKSKTDDLCANKTEGAECAAGKTCQKDGDKLVCKTSEPAPDESDLCANKTEGASCADGKTCQTEGDKLVCKTSEPAPDETDLCANKTEGATCADGKTCQTEGGKLVCKTSEPAPDETDLCANKTEGAACADGKTCQTEGDKLVCKTSEPAPDETDLCANKTEGAACADGKTCQTEGGKLVCKTSEPAPDDATHRACGSAYCSGSQYCDAKTQKCVDRSTQAVEGIACTEEGLIENCVGGKLVYCDSNDKETRVTDCAADNSVCALKRDENFGICVKPNERCNAQTVGTVNVCHDSEVVGGTSYLEEFDCARATDGNYYMFRTWKTTDCVGTCIDETQCSVSEETCVKSEFKDRCDGDVLVYCASAGGGKPTVVNRTNCADYGISCIADEASGADCDWASTTE